MDITKTKEIKNTFLKSALTSENCFISTNELLRWIHDKREKVKHKIEQIPLSSLVDWNFQKDSGNLCHTTGRFFSIEGISIETNWGRLGSWSQPIIIQPEIGFLGIIAKKFNGVLYFLMQAKIEPGNLNIVQLSPTLQATKSNYNRVHNGNSPHYLSYFLNKRKDTVVLLDQLQSEQGARFFKKRNRNIIIEVFADIEVRDNFCWLTIGQIKQLLAYDNIVNMDTRTVIAGIPYGDQMLYGNDHVLSNNKFLESELCTTNSVNTIEDVISWITRLKSFAELEVTKIPLNSVNEWCKNEWEIFHREKKYFSVIAVETEINNREVQRWTQPLIKSAQEGIIAFIIKKINNIYHFLVQAKLESGNFDIIELAPTIQCLTGNYRKGKNEYSVEYLDYVLNSHKYDTIVHYDTLQSEEGGRFYQEQNRNIILEVSDDFDQKVSDKFIWMTLHQLKSFIKFNNYLNIQARSLISTIQFE